MLTVTQSNIQYIRYTIEDIEIATDYFSNTLKIGERGYGPVFRGNLDHIFVAIKVLRPDISQGGSQFQKEVELRKNDTPVLPWTLRFKICAEIATAVHFLHQTRPQPLVHRDLKSGNILLDRNYVSKISEVGLARLIPPEFADDGAQYYITASGSGRSGSRVEWRGIKFFH
ncbi:hypothetical protein L1887_38146 [Cichorium endivia]|nr:hypothetical protein L1887_38146 [Cichorium endivia]